LLSLLLLLLLYTTSVEPDVNIDNKKRYYIDKNALHQIYSVDQSLYLHVEYYYLTL